MKSFYHWLAMSAAVLMLASCGSKSSSSSSGGGDVAHDLKGKTHLMVDGEYVETELKETEYYLLYFTASW